ncbi:MAG: homoserine dehydrogenase [Lachnospiraceae bacterium]|nr:homoserine dehydrogenase [Lachnospiraceae bacterium]
MVNIAVLGYGTVGSGVVKVLTTNQEKIDKKAGTPVRVKYVLDLRDFPGDPIQEKIVHDFDVILKDPEVKIVVEVMGGLKPAYDFTRAALEAGKSVCTSNKELVAEHGAEFLDLAREKNVNYLFEASCGGGIPVIRILNSSLTAEDIDEVSGILNGTTNYILTEMTEKGSDFDSALKEAQELGYAERNPEADVEGHDACRKIAILSSLAFGHTVKFNDIHTEGITKISHNDIVFAKKFGMLIKLLASAYKVKGEGDKKDYYAMVAPFLMKQGHPLYNVNGVFNAVFIHGNMLGDSMFYGSGAGSLPTASAVVGDVVDAVKHLSRTLFVFWDSRELKLSDNSTAERSFFIRVPKDKKADASALFNALETAESDEIENEAALITGMMTESEFDKKCESRGYVLSRIRVNQ